MYLIFPKRFFKILTPSFFSISAIKKLNNIAIKRRDIKVMAIIFIDRFLIIKRNNMPTETIIAPLDRVNKRPVALIIARARCCFLDVTIATPMKKNKYNARIGAKSFDFPINGLSNLKNASGCKDDLDKLGPSSEKSEITETKGRRVQYKMAINIAIIKNNPMQFKMNKEEQFLNTLIISK